MADESLNPYQGEPSVDYSRANETTGELYQDDPRSLANAIPYDALGLLLGKSPAEASGTDWLAGILGSAPMEKLPMAAATLGFAPSLLPYINKLDSIPALKTLLDKFRALPTPLDINTNSGLGNFGETAAQIIEPAGLNTTRKTSVLSPGLLGAVRASETPNALNQFINPQRMYNPYDPKFAQTVTINPKLHEVDSANIMNTLVHELKHADMNTVDEETGYLLSLEALKQKRNLLPADIKELDTLVARGGKHFVPAEHAVRLFANKYFNPYTLEHKNY